MGVAGLRKRWIYLALCNNWADLTHEISSPTYLHSVVVMSYVCSVHVHQVPIETWRLVTVGVFFATTLKFSPSRLRRRLSIQYSRIKCHPYESFGRSTLIINSGTSLGGLIDKRVQRNTTHGSNSIDTFIYSTSYTCIARVSSWSRSIRNGHQTVYFVVAVHMADGCDEHLVCLSDDDSTVLWKSIIDLEYEYI